MSIDSLTLVDWFIIAIFAFSIFMGITRGMVKELLSLVIWTIAAYAVTHYSVGFSEMLPFLAKYDFSVKLKAGIAGIILLIIIIVIGGIIRKLVDGLINFSGLDGTDKTLGAVFGLLRGFVLIMLMITLILQLFSVEDSDWWRESTMLPYFVQFKDDALAIMQSIRQFF